MSATLSFIQFKTLQFKLFFLSQARLGVGKVEHSSRLEMVCLWHGSHQLSRLVSRLILKGGLPALCFQLSSLHFHHVSKLQWFTARHHEMTLTWYSLRPSDPRGLSSIRRGCGFDWGWGFALSGKRTSWMDWRESAQNLADLRRLYDQPIFPELAEIRIYYHRHRLWNWQK